MLLYRTITVAHLDTYKGRVHAFGGFYGHAYTIMIKTWQKSDLSTVHRMTEYIL